MILIPEKYYKNFEEAGVVRQFQPNEMIFMQEDEADSIYLIESGRVRVFLVSEEGKNTTIQILQKGRIFGDASFVKNAVRKVNIESVTQCRIVKVKMTDIVQVLHESEELMVLMFAHMTETTNYLQHQIERLTYMNSEEKVIDFLYELSEGRHTVPFSHENIAECLAMNRVTVSKILKKLESQSLVESGYGTITVLDRNGLKKLLQKV